MTGRRRKAASRVAQGVALLAATCLALEVLVRISIPQPEAIRWHKPDERYGHVMRRDFHQRYPFPGTDFVMDVQTNAAGLRDEELSTKSPDTTTIVLAGDSFMFGYAVNIEDRVDTSLRSLLGPAYRVINTGTVAWGTLQETAYLRDHFETFEPDIIVLAFCGNDPDDDRVFLSRRVSFDASTFPGKALLRRYSHAFRLATHRFAAWRHDRDVQRRLRGESKDAGEATLDPQTFKPRLPRDLADSMCHLQQFHEDFLSFNPGGKVVLIATMPTDEAISAQLARLDNGSSLRYLDLSGVAQTLGDGIRQPFDGHWSPAMHRAVAEQLGQFITSRVWPAQQAANVTTGHRS
jgi:hypothetical protein